MFEKRRYERVSFFCRVTLAPMSGGSPFEAQCVDISLGGAGISSRKLIAAGQPISVTFHMKNAAQKDVAEPVFGKVVRVVSDIDGHHLGVDFVEPLQATRNPELCKKVERL
jgi:c-di-GMP-binding flagellar brake protein YcgR